MYLTAAEIKKQREREARIQALVDQVDDWDMQTIIERAKYAVRESYEAYSDAELIKTYNEAFGDEDLYVGRNSRFSAKNARGY